MTHLDVWQEKYGSERPHRLLALDGGGLRDLGLDDIAHENMQTLDAVAHIDDMRRSARPMPHAIST